MDEAAKRFARRILLLHVLLLVGVLALVALTSREVYRSTRNGVIEQAKFRQELLANQTARGIESQYQAVLSNLDLFRRAENEESTTQPAGGVARSLLDRALQRGGGRLSNGAPGGPGPGLDGPPPDERPGNVPSEANRFNGTRGFTGDQGVPPANGSNTQRARGGGGGASPRVIDEILWRQLQGRVSLLFGLNRSALSQPETPVTLIGKDEPRVTPELIVNQSRAWLANVQQPSISEFQMYDGTGANLVCIPFPRGRLLVAVVPIRIIEQKFLKDMNDDPHTGAWLIDERLTAMAGSRTGLAGASMADISDASVKKLASDFTNHGRTGTQLIEHTFHVGNTTFSPSLVSAEPVHAGDKTWGLFIATGTDQIDGIVAGLFHRALIWGTVVVIVITGLLVSTAAQLIRSRTRLERVRHEMLTRELSQARQIQLAWLPNVQPASQCVEIAAVNTPASHISGDFYNWFDLDDGRTVVTIGDVTGHGMAAAFLMATTQLLVRNTMPRVHGDPGACLEDVNRQLCTQVFNGQFVTMLIAVLDCDGANLQIATAGHPSPLMSAGATFEPLPLEPQLVLGVDPHAKYHTEQFELSGTRRLLLYTDGVVDCLANSGLRFGNERLTQSLRQSRAGAEDLLGCVVTSVETFRHRCELTDDLTLVAVQTQMAKADPARTSMLATV